MATLTSPWRMMRSDSRGQRRDSEVLTGRGGGGAPVASPDEDWLALGESHGTQLAQEHGLAVGGRGVECLAITYS